VIIENWSTSTFTKLSEAWNKALAARRTILSGKEGLALKHLGENTSHASNIDGDIIIFQGNMISGAQ